MNRCKSLLVLIIIFVFAISIKSPSKEKISFELGGNVLYNGYFGNFNGFPNYDCCGTFTNGKGLGFNLSATGIYKSIFATQIASINYFTSISLRDLSGKFEYEEYFADVIIDENLFKAISRHTLQTDILALSLVPGFDFENLLSVKPLTIRLGTSISIPLKNNFHQKEELVSPEKAYFENNQKTRNVFDGKINNFRTPLFGLFCKIGWKFQFASNLYILPNLYFDVPLSTLVKNINLNTYHMAFGVSVGYNIPKPMPLPPVVPPILDFPEPQQPKESKPIQMQILVNLEKENRNIGNNDTIYITRKIQQTSVVSPTPTIIFYQKNDFLFGEDTIPTTQAYQEYYNENRKILRAVVDFLKVNPNQKISLACSQTNDESANICDLRIARLVEFFRSQGLENRIESTSKEISKPTKPIPELLEEERNIKIVFSDGMKIVDRKAITKIDTTSYFPKLNILTRIEPETNYQIQGKVVSSFDTFNFNKNTYKIDLGKLLKTNNLYSDSLRILVHITTMEDLPQNATDSIKIHFKIIEEIQNEFAYYNPIDGKNYILAALFKFDETEPYWVNEKLGEIVSKLLSEGRRVQIVGSVDNLGSETHNRSLATERAKKIKKHLGKDLPIKTIEIDKRPQTQNPFERIQNRSAWIYFE